MDSNRACEIAGVIGQGGIVASPTDTVYGLLADAINEEAVKRLFELKRRPKSKPFLVLVNSIESARRFAGFTDEALEVVHHFWVKEKKPLTVVVPLLQCSEDYIAKSVTAGEATIAIRLPNHEPLLEIMECLGRPVVAPSANIHGQPQAMSYNDVIAAFGEEVPGISMVLDGGESRCLSASTIVNLSRKPYTILREGSAQLNEIVEIVGLL
ncbi:MAG: threonylcarbamoyl-AMP synthase [Holosporales bacterium]|jgi:L-threonylcarbamoyladenylate synthase|nr:threonylcarbamoyl-AMP synthase [Holosporales bacterium]